MSIKIILVVIIFIFLLAYYQYKRYKYVSKVIPGRIVIPLLLMFFSVFYIFQGVYPAKVTIKNIDNKLVAYVHTRALARPFTDIERTVTNLKMAEADYNDLLSTEIGFVDVLNQTYRYYFRSNTTSFLIVLYSYDTVSRTVIETPFLTYRQARKIEKQINESINNKTELEQTISNNILLTFGLLVFFIAFFIFVLDVRWLIGKLSDDSIANE